jgi:hypothetical protein
MQTIERRSGMHAVFVGMRVPNADDQTEHRNQCRGIVERAHHGIASRPLYWGSDTVLDGCTTAHTVRRGDAQPGILKSATTGQVFTQMPVCLKVDKKLAYSALLCAFPRCRHPLHRATATFCTTPPPPSAPCHTSLHGAPRLAVLLPAIDGSRHFPLPVYTASSMCLNFFLSRHIKIFSSDWLFLPVVSRAPSPSLELPLPTVPSQLDSSCSTVHEDSESCVVRISLI